jgi:hypothetical protein
MRKSTKYTALTLCVLDFALQRIPISNTIINLSIKGIVLVTGKAANQGNINALQKLNQGHVKFIKLEERTAKLLIGILNNHFVASALHFISCHITLLKSVPYHPPKAASDSFHIIYFGDGLGLIPICGYLPWFPECPPTLDRITNIKNNSKSVSHIPLIYYSERPTSKPNAFWEVNKSSISLIKDLIKSETDSTRLKVRIELACEYSDVLFLSTLSGYRTSAENELALLAEYSANNCNINIKGRLLAFLHPHHLGDRDYKLSIKRAFARSYIGGMQSISIVGLDEEAAFFEGLCAEHFCSLLAEQSDTSSNLPTIHSFQTAHLFLASMYPTLKLKFGYGPEMINKYFFKNTKSQQIRFESSVSSFVESLR